MVPFALSSLMESPVDVEIAIGSITPAGKTLLIEVGKSPFG
jgi:hypothetical protein